MSEVRYGSGCNSCQKGARAASVAMSLSSAACQASSKIVAILVVGTIVFAHIGTLWLPFVNQEQAFNAAARYFHTGDIALAQRFFNSDANTLVLGAVGAALAELLHIDTDWGCRLVSLIGFAVFAAALQSLITQAGLTTWLLSAAIMVNPLIWVFAGRGTADFPPMAFAMAAIAICWRAQGIAMAVAGALVFAFAAALKYHAVLLLPLFAMSPAPRQSATFRVFMVTTVSIATLVTLSAYNVAVFRSFGFWLTSPQWVSAHGPTVQNILTNIVHYGGFLALLGMPFSLQSAFASPAGRIFKILAVGMVALMGAAMPPSAGEMNFGPFDRWVGASFSGVVLAGLFAIFVFSLLNRLQSVQDRSVVGAIVLVLLALSFSRPAQRYLIFVVPIYVLYLSAPTRIDVRRFAGPLIAICIAINIFSAVTQNYFRAAPSEHFGAAREWK
ncbi:hypothetical protein [Rhodopseudomonas sp. B29]|uniref:hypothetical protein n=1 Tax=Rhodopseudomonas sp. B29 TaxID=95607 RepID=UPI00034B4A9B|nr:hypothetical protein [Rhodopseudomonas sp. B29]